MTFFLDIADYFVRIRHPEYSHLPPASLRMRIGVGNRLLRNHSLFVGVGRHYVNDLMKRGYLTPKSRVLEIGCGCGRLAMELAHVLDDEGYYLGQDIDIEMIAWCQKNLEDTRLHFRHADIFSAVYNPRGRDIAAYRLPAEDNSLDLVVATSVFTHLLHQDFSHYVRESSRVLADGGLLYASFFVMDYVRSSLGDRWSFPHKVENCYVENVKYPEAAVAYDLEVIQQTLSNAGFSIVEIYNKDLSQQTIVARKT